MMGAAVAALVSAVVQLLGSLVVLTKAVRSKHLRTRDRLGLIRDIFALAEPGKLSTTDGLENHFAASHHGNGPRVE